MLYQAYQTQSDLMSPYRLLAQGGSAGLWMENTQGSWMRKLSASMEVFSRMRLTHSRPAYGITSVMVGAQELAVTEEQVLSLPFGTLLRFKKDTPPNLPYQPPVLLVAPLSGHFSTLLLLKDPWCEARQSSSDQHCQVRIKTPPASCKQLAGGYLCQ